MDIIFDNSAARLVGAPTSVIDALRYDLAYDSGAPPQIGQWRADGTWDAGWDGWYRMITPRGELASGLVPQALKILAKYGIPCGVVDQRQRPAENIPWQSRGLPIPRDYQLRAVDKALAAGRGVIDSAPRSGKTLMGAMIVDKLAFNAVWIAPTKTIVRQTVRALASMLNGISVMAVTGDSASTPKRREIQRKKAREAQIVVTTEATAVKLGRGFFNTRNVLIYDEFHHVSSDRGQEINRLSDGIYYRFGLTGTHFRSDKNTEIRMHAVLSHVIERIPVADLVAGGWLVPANVIFIPVDHPKVYTRSVVDSFDEAITYHDVRNTWITWAAQHLVSRGYRPIILVGRVDHGEEIQKMIHAQTGAAPIFVNAKTQTTDFNQNAIDSYNAGEQTMLVGTSVLGEGVDLPAADALIYAKTGRASVTVTQDFFRVLTAHEGKSHGVVIDFADRHHHGFLEQSVARSKIYAAEECFSVGVLDAIDPAADLDRRIL